jgi:hypothetical protein
MEVKLKKQMKVKKITDFEKNIEKILFLKKRLNKFKAVL